MKEPVLVVMAAGMGSRYGGLKQIDPVDQEGHIIMDFSIYDAVRAGFKKVIFIIKKENEQDFRDAIGDRLSDKVEIVYVHQDLNNIPEGFQVPEGRVKPWGTGQAVLSCRGLIQEPFAVINADDYYGKEAFHNLYHFLREEHAENHFCMAGFVLKNTLSDNGAVTRGICQMDQNGYLQAVHETQGIVKTPDGAQADGGNLDPDVIVSMNMWGLTPHFIEMLGEGFQDFLQEHGQEMKLEFLLPIFLDNLLQQGKVSVQVLPTHDRWFGVTYQEDKQGVVSAFMELISRGEYVTPLFVES